MRVSARAILVKDNQLLVMKRNKFGREFYALVGGGVDLGETPEQALQREVSEEASLQIASYRLVIVEDAGAMYGMQYIYECQYGGGEPALAPDSEEAKISALGQNLYQPMWLPLEQLPNVDFLPEELRPVIIKGLQEGFPAEPIQLKIAG